MFVKYLSQKLRKFNSSYILQLYILFTILASELPFSDAKWKTYSSNSELRPFIGGFKQNFPIFVGKTLINNTWYPAEMIDFTTYTVLNNNRKAVDDSFKILCQENDYDYDWQQMNGTCIPDNAVSLPFEKRVSFIGRSICSENIDTIGRILFDEPYVYVIGICSYKVSFLSPVEILVRKPANRMMHIGNWKPRQQARNLKMNAVKVTDGNQRNTLYVGRAFYKNSNYVAKVLNPDEAYIYWQHQSLRVNNFEVLYKEEKYNYSWKWKNFNDVSLPQNALPCFGELDMSENNNYCYIGRAKFENTYAIGTIRDGGTLIIISNAFHTLPYYTFEVLVKENKFGVY